MVKNLEINSGVFFRYVRYTLTFALVLCGVVVEGQVCPIVNDTFYILNNGSPVYINYLRKATNQTLRTTPHTVPNNIPYAWAADGNTYPLNVVETNNRYYLDGSAPLVNQNTPSNLTPLSYSTVLPGQYLEFGQYANPSSPVPSGITDKVVRLTIPVNFYGWASLDYNYESCYPYLIERTQRQTYCDNLGTVTLTSTAYTIDQPCTIQFISTYTCTYYGGVCSSFSSSCTTITYSSTSTYTSLSCLAYTTSLFTTFTSLNTAMCAPTGSTARSTCSKKIVLYVRAPLDVELIKTCSKSSYAADELISFSVIVNSALYSEEADSGYVTDILPAGLNLVSYSTTGGSYNVQSGVWTIPRIGNGKHYTLTVNANATETKSYTNTATFRFTNRLDFDSTNNTMSCSFTATASTKASIKPPYACSIFTAGNTPVCPDSSGLVFTVNPIAVQGVTYQWTVPTGFSIISGQGTNSISVKSGQKAGVVSANVFIPATATTSATTCERSFPVSIISVNSDIRIRKP
ncbi:MAG: hypothetical protein U0T32_05235 [Chitinophagales bacterium]